MKTWKKVLLGVGGLAVLGIGSSIFRYETTKDVTTVQSGKVTREDLTSIVTASGEVKPRTYSNVLGEGFGKITEIVVKEGDRVKRGDELLRLESIQPGADVDAQRAAIQSAQDALTSAEANFRSAEATVAQRKATFEGADLDWQRGQELYKAGLIPKQDYDSRKATYDGAKAGLVASQAQMQQARSDRDKAQANLDQQKYMLTRLADVLRKTTYVAPIDGVVTYIAVRVGENVVPGIQNSSGSYLMTISDMSVVTAEVMADETDVVNVHLGQVADVTIDAIPGKTFKGKVTEMGDQAIIRSTGLATTQTQASNQEAKDFKVVVTLDDPPQNVRPGSPPRRRSRPRRRRACCPFRCSPSPCARARTWTTPRKQRRRRRRNRAAWCWPRPVRPLRARTPRGKRFKACLWCATATCSLSRWKPASPGSPTSR